MTSNRNHEYAKSVLGGLDQNAIEVNREDGFSPIMSVLKIMTRQYWDHIEHLYDMLPVVWGVEPRVFEQLLGVPSGWLAAYRIHEVKPEDETWTQLSALLGLHLAMRMVVEPGGYARWLRQPWTAESAIGSQSPLELLLAEGQKGLERLKAICLAQTQ